MQIANYSKNIKFDRNLMIIVIHCRKMRGEKKTDHYTLNRMLLLEKRKPKYAYTYTQVANKRKERICSLIFVGWFFLFL